MNIKFFSRMSLLSAIFAVSLVALAQRASASEPISTITPDCQVGDWSPWSACSKGTQKHTRAVVKKPVAGKSCPVLVETRACGKKTPIDCQVSEWGQWTPCDQASGTRKHNRSVVTMPSSGGKTCPDLSQTQSCGAPH